MIRLILWLLDWWDAIREAKQIHVKIKPEWYRDKYDNTKER